MSLLLMALPRSVLVTTVGAATGLCVVRALRAAMGDSIRIVGTDMQPATRVAGAAFVDVFEVVPGARDESYAEALLALVEREQAEFVIPIYDVEVLQVSTLAAALAERGARTLVAAPEAVEVCNSKLATSRALRAARLPTPETIDLATADAASLPYPVICKPDDGVGSKATSRVDDPAHLEIALAQTPSPVAQPLLTGTEHTVEVVADREGTAVATVTRERLETKEGVATKSRTVDRPDVTKLATEVVHALGLVGASNIQMIGDDGNYEVIDVNPRFAAGQPLGMAAGVNLPHILLRVADGEPVPAAHAEPGLTMLRYYEEVFVREP
jgi:carbamoyl-phosphate synthase large subunit